MAAYRPGQGLNKQAVARLQERKQLNEGIADVPAEDRNEQWTKVLGGEGQKKKLRCGSCTRPLSDEEISQKLLVCSRCKNGEIEKEGVVGLSLELDEFSTSIEYYCQCIASAHIQAVPDPPPLKCRSKPEAMRVEVDANDIFRIERGTSMGSNDLLSHVPKGSTSLSVLSFNLLASCYVRVEGQPWNAFSYCADEHLAWENRLPRVLDLLNASGADIICLQEVVVERRALSPGAPEEWNLPAWTDQLHGYKGVLQGLKQKEWDKNSERNLRACGSSTPTGVATFYRNERLEESSVSKHGSGSGTTLFLRCREQPEPGSAPLEVAIANIHLVGDPSKSDSHVKALEGVKKNLGRQALRIVCGDFNSECERGSEVANWFADEGFIEVPTGTSWAEPSKALRLDHMFATSGLRIIAASGNLSAEEVATGMPCASCPSDHAPVAALFSGTMPGRCPW